MLVFWVFILKDLSNNNYSSRQDVLVTCNGRSSRRVYLRTLGMTFGAHIFGQLVQLMPPK